MRPTSNEVCMYPNTRTKGGVIPIAERHAFTAPDKDYAKAECSEDESEKRRVERCHKEAHGWAF